MKRNLKNKMYLSIGLILIGMMMTACGAAVEPEQNAETHADIEKELKTEESMEKDTATVGEIVDEIETTVSDESDLMEYDKQLQLIADSVNSWMNDVNESMDRYFYAVTDLDENGQLELIRSACMGTGFFTYSNFWEVNENGTELIPCQYPMGGKESEPDIIGDPNTVYFDEANFYYYYQYYDDIRIGAAEYSQSPIALSIQNGVVDTKILGQSHTVYNEAGDSETTYVSADGTVIDEAAYNSLAEQTFAGMTKMQATIDWKTADEYGLDHVAEMTAEELMDMLKTSWEGFNFY